MGKGAYKRLGTFKVNESESRGVLDIVLCLPNRTNVYFLSSSALDGGDFASIDKDLQETHHTVLFTEEVKMVQEMKKMLVGILVLEAIYIAIVKVTWILIIDSDTD